LYTFLGKKSLQGAWRPFASTGRPCPSADCPRIISIGSPAKTASVDSSQGGTLPLTLPPLCPHTGISSPHHQMNFSTLIRAAVRASLIQNGPQTCSDLVRGMGLDPRRHKGTVHAVMVDLEREGALGATMKGTRRDLWFCSH
jgi:hypothetical protein